MKKQLLALLAVVMAGGASEAVAQQTTRNATATITIPQVLFLDVTGTNITFGSPDVAQFDAGKIAATTQSVISHRGNVPHSVQITADQEFFQEQSTGSASGKSAADLRWSKDGSSFQGLSTTPADVVANAARGAYMSATTVSYQMVLDYAKDKPDTYTLPFRFTIIAN
jgi:hypothetical protein